MSEASCVGMELPQQPEEELFDARGPIDKKEQKVVKIAANGEVCKSVETAETFASLNLRPRLLKGLYTMGFKIPTELQKVALPHVLANPPRNTIIAAEKDKGKMVTCALAMLSRVDESSQKTQHTQCLCVAPSNKVVMAIGKLTAVIAKDIPNIRIGYPFEKSQYAVLERNDNMVPAKSTQILIGTPSTIKPHIQQLATTSNMPAGIDAKKIDIFVIYKGEDMESNDQLQQHTECLSIQRSLREDCQTLFFSSTFTEVMFSQRIIPTAPIIRFQIQDTKTSAPKPLVASTSRAAMGGTRTLKQTKFPICSDDESDDEGDEDFKNWLEETDAKKAKAKQANIVRKIGQSSLPNKSTDVEDMRKELKQMRTDGASSAGGWRSRRNREQVHVVELDSTVCQKINTLMSKIQVKEEKTFAQSGNEELQLVEEDTTTLSNDLPDECNLKPDIVITNPNVVSQDAAVLNHPIQETIEPVAEDDVEPHSINLNTDGNDRQPNAFDKRLKREFATKQKLPKYKSMLAYRRKLPAYKMREEILKTIAENQVVVLSGETGCGKTTQVPQFILDDFISRGEGSNCSIVCTQPRRISAFSVAQRVSDERVEKCGYGSSCGYLIRLENEAPIRKASILYCTTQCVLRFMENDPLILQTSHIILDEIHERDVFSDFLIIILKSLLVKRPDVKVILMSATLNAEMFSTYFNNCAMLHIPGKTFPVKKHYLEDVLELTNYKKDAKQDTGSCLDASSFDDERDQMEYNHWLRKCLRDGRISKRTYDVLLEFNEAAIRYDLIAAVVKHIITKEEEGAILVFVPGWDDITRTIASIKKTDAFNDNTLVIPLHSQLSTVNQRQVFDRPPAGVRKIIVATNIAETSITIDDVVYVVDSGKIKVKDFVPEMNLCTLDAQWVSLANAKQRSGRAGRVQAGKCYHLFTSYQKEKLPKYLPAEMLRSNLEELCLQIKLLKLGGIEELVSRAIEPPSSQAVKAAIQMLRSIKAMDPEERLTALGHHLARMPLDPHTGKMILFGAMFCCLDPILTVAASLSFKNAFVVPFDDQADADTVKKKLAKGSKSDHIMLVNAFKEWELAKRYGCGKDYCWDHYLSEYTLKQLLDYKWQFSEILFNMGFINTYNPKDKQANINSGKLPIIRAVLCAGLYPNVARISELKHLKTKNDKDKVRIHKKSVNGGEKCDTFESDFFIFHKKLKTREVFLHDTSCIPTLPLLLFSGDFKRSGHGITIDGWMNFYTDASTITALRTELDKILEAKIKTPGVTVWTGTEGDVLKSIVDLIMSQKHV